MGSLIIVGAYSCVFTLGAYGYNDDYMLLYRVQHGDFGLSHNEQIGMGRPLAAALLYAAFRCCEASVQKLVWLRVFSLAQICLFFIVFSWALIRARYSRRFAFTAALLLVLSPAFGVYAAWATACFSSLALLFSLGAGLLIERSLRAPAAQRWRYWLTAGVLIWLGCNLWQAAVPLALFPSFVAAWKGLESSRDLRGSAAIGRGLWISAWVLAASVMVYFSLHKLGLWLGWIPSFGSKRGTFTADLAGKIHLLVDLLRSGLTSWGRFHPGLAEWAIGTLTAACCLSAVLKIGRLNQPAVSALSLRLLLSTAMLLAAVSPVLAAREDNAAFRSLGPLYAVIIFLGCDGVRHLLAARVNRWRNGGIALLLVITAGAAHYHVRRGLVEPNRREYRETRRLIRQRFQEMPAHLVYLLPPYTLLARGMTPSWEYGLISSPFWWVTKPFLLLLFQDLSPHHRSLDESALAVHYREKGNVGLAVLNPMPALLRTKGIWREDPLWGRVLEFPRGWIYSPWLGYVEARQLPFLQHHLLGTLTLIHSARPGELWLHKDGFGMFFTSSETFPNLYLSETKEWVSLADDNGDPGHLYDSRKREWLLFPKNYMLSSPRR
ncbi:MAG: glycosyltransferase family 39 protein [Verrucomicrobiota bacterium]|nr:glycosyltransferase family 39 protein [Verrucomicrobiota bacterium]